MESCAKIFIPRSKADVYREGNYVFIAKSNSKYCPVNLLARYMKGAKIDPRCSLPIFRPLVKTKRGYMLRDGKLSYSRCRKIFKDALTALGYDTTRFGLHSLRLGGITSATQNSSSLPLSDRLLKLHGRWKTDLAKDMYVQETLENRLSVTKRLGL